MRRLLNAATIAAALLTAACADDDLTRPDVRSDTSEAAQDALNPDKDGNLGNPHVFLKPPVVDSPDPAAFGTFDPGLSPVVEVCALDTANDTCGTLLIANDGSGIARYTRDGGPGGEAVVVDLAAEEYQVEIHFKLFDLVQDKPYRVQTRVGGQIVAYADVQMISAREMRNAKEENSILFPNDNRTLPWNVRIDEGALCWEVGATVLTCSSETVLAGTEKTVSLTTSHGDEVVFTLPSGWQGHVNGHPQEDITLTIEELPVANGSCFQVYALDDPSTGNPERCYKVRADTDTETDVEVEFSGPTLPILAFCPDPEVVALINNGQDNWLITSVEEDQANQTPQVYQNAQPPAGFPGCSATASAGTALGHFAASVWRHVRPALSPLLPLPLHAADLGFGGTIQRLSTIFFWSRFPDAIEISPANPVIAQGGTVQLGVTGSYHHGPADGNTVEVSWSVGAPGAATVDAITGLVTASSTSAGPTTITATSTNVLGFDGEPLTATTEVTVVALPTGGVLQIEVEQEGDPLGGVTLTLQGATTLVTTTDVSGAAAFNQAPAGTYTLTPSLTGVAFKPRTVTVPATGTSSELVLGYDASRPVFCWDGHPDQNRRCYEYVPATVNWSDAKANAEGLSFNPGSGTVSGYLATITSQAEQTFLLKMQAELDFTHHVSQPAGNAFFEAWLGATDVLTEGTWEWGGGEGTFTSNNFSNWFGGEPNGGTSENYLEWFTSAGQWNDAPPEIDNGNLGINDNGMLVEYEDAPVS